ncbi:DUF3900 domain-containing protein [Alkalihalobacterium chitinilyticum]|uniref:DUF3900 domain-containing protein n=1 Tax=Alkalihalobacterium chitinilyticum TaxID=2980103 RepID=A0ABT5VBY0_9BACI|nr:DUF3900 domain-containing protein [Alkalihalobacterium chitinilyticum]MDE5412847.1 DUF3900 domain-containing protein [Alkalihalobacterium chitinilyticum]
MDFDIQYLSFFVIDSEGQGEQGAKSYKHYQTLDEVSYVNHPLSDFLEGELMKISKRKVERHPKSDQVPTKIGRFLVEEGYDLASNPNYNQFNKIRSAESSGDFQLSCEQLVRSYMDTSSIRGGALIVARAKLNKYFDEPFVFVLKCDFEPKVATITDERSLIQQVEMAITTKNMKSIQYPYMPEEGMIEEWELKIHQSSHSRYFEDFLKFVEYERSMPEIVKDQVITLAKQYYEDTGVMPNLKITEPEEEETVETEETEATSPTEAPSPPPQTDFDTTMEVWATTPKRELQEQWSAEQVMEASYHLVEQIPELDLSFKLDHIGIKALLSDFGVNVHIGKQNGRYYVLLEGDRLEFGKGASPVEFLRPNEMKDIIDKIGK